ncbi:MAG TPA: aminotransferase class I/II-fold pyridoxal phosphate-dependent enzyme [Jiangellaceae bacterium]
MTATLPDFALEVYLGRHEFSAKHYLCGSDAQTLTVRELLDLASDEERAAFDRLPLLYTPSWGGQRLLDAIAATYDEVDSEHVLTFAGAEEGIFWAMQRLVGPGDHAVVVVPTYQATESVPIAAGAEVSGLALDPAEGWALDLDRLRRLLRPDTRLVAVNFPNNPTGALPDRETFTALVELCDERGIRLFSDEVYRGAEPDPDRTLPQAADLSSTALSLNVMSKSYGLPGLRIGWIACRDRVVLERLERGKHFTSICNAAPSELLAAIALRNRAAIHARVRAIIAGNVPLFDAFFASWPELFDWEPPRGGCVCFPRYRGPGSVDELCRELVERSGIVLLPGSVFRSTLAPVPTDRFRIGVARASVEPGLAAFDDFLRRWL